MDLETMIDGYRFAPFKKVLENYHYSCIEKIKDEYYEEIKNGNLETFAHELNRLSKAYKEENQLKKKVSVNYKTVVLVAAKNNVIEFLRNYHNVLFIILTEIKIEEEYNEVINDDCDIIYYLINNMTNPQKDGIFSYILFNIIKISDDIKNINIFTDNSHYFEGLIGCLEHYGIDTKCHLFSDKVNKIINLIRLEKIHPKTIDKLKIYIEKHGKADSDDIIDELLEFGYCYFNDKNEICYLKELI